MSLQTSTQYVIELPYRAYSAVSAWWFGENKAISGSFEQNLATTVVKLSHNAQDSAIRQARAMGNHALAERLECIRQQS